MPRVEMVIGCPASGKSTTSGKLVNSGYIHLNRDKEGGRVIDLLPKMVAALNSGQNVVIDNLHTTAASRKPFIDAAKSMGIEIGCTWVATTIQDATINALNRMWDRYGKLFLAPEDFKGTKDSNMFPISVLFKYEREFQKPSTAEGFSAVNRIQFTRKPLEGHTYKAVIFDYDGTLRTVKGGEFMFPTSPEQVEILPNRVETLDRLSKEGYLLLGVSNQSGVARGQVSFVDAVRCFERTNELLGKPIQFDFCPHNVPPVCFCRKPQSGLGVKMIRMYKLDPSKCIFVGDQTTDKTFATRLGFQYADQKTFFG